ncbi:uncharacterized protein Dvir_GJ18824 [Drosophila virilis]|uniref:Uncharacterized protein n=1 Tax=Drosophila virilis TaxID=7244 RepID=B4M1M1_DROVI|nr:uncharacterized protein Dvir_GJ18824 [Drosophila virilis]
MNNLSPVFYNAESVRRVLNWPMVNEAVEAALKAVVDHTSEPNANAGVEHMEQDQGNELQSNNSSKSYVTVGAGEVHFGEVSADIYAESLVYVDCLSNAEHELVGLPAPIAGELGGVIIHGNYPDEQAVTIFQSMGMASEDACVAEAVQSALLSCAK